MAAASTIRRAAAAPARGTPAASAPDTAARPASRGRTPALCLAAAAALLLFWSFATPIFEGPDEYLHWQYARYLHDRWQLPFYEASFAEANQPPLYYLAVAPFASRTMGPPPLVWMDARDQVQSPFLPRLHLNAADDYTRYWPIRIARLITALMALAALVCCWQAGIEATGRRSTGLLAAGFALLLPQFAFRGTHVNNDVLVTTTAALATWLAIRIVRRGFTWRVGWLAAAAVGATYLSKINGACVVPAVALAILMDRASSWRQRLAHLSVFALALAMVLPWTIRNITLYGDPFASGAMYHAVPAFIGEQSLWSLNHVTSLPREAFKSFVGYFGYLTVKLPKWAYAGYLLFMTAALAGLLRRALRDRAIARIALVLAVVMVCCYALLVRINLQFVQPQGRYLFPALPALMIALAIGLEGWRPWSSASAGAEAPPDSRGLPGAASLTSSTIGWPAWAAVGAWAAAHAAVLAFVLLPAFHPPFVSRLSTARTEVRLEASRDLTPAAGPDDRTWTIEGAQPTLTADVRVPASDALFVLVDIEGSGAAAPAIDGGALILSLQDDADQAAAPREVRLPFDWLADGRRRGPRYSLLGRPDWRGTVTRVRLVLADAPDARLRGTVVRLRSLQLAGSAPGHDF